MNLPWSDSTRHFVCSCFYCPNCHPREKQHEKASPINNSRSPGHHDANFKIVVQMINSSTVIQFLLHCSLAWNGGRGESGAWSSPALLPMEGFKKQAGCCLQSTPARSLGCFCGGQQFEYPPLWHSKSNKTFSQIAVCTQYLSSVELNLWGNFHSICSLSSVHFDLLCASSLSGLSPSRIWAPSNACKVFCPETIP